MSKSYLLAKVGEQQYMKRLFDMGEVYFRPRVDFAAMDDTNGIGDKFEAALNYYSPKNPQISIRFPWGEIMELSDKSRVQYGEHSDEINGLIYCMALVEYEAIPNGCKINIPKMIVNIGNEYDSIVVIYDVPTFIDRVKVEVERMCKSVIYSDFVSYYPERDIIKKQLTPFEKIEKYAHQREYRFYIDSDLKQPLLISIGSIKDIARIIYLKRGVNNYAL